MQKFIGSLFFTWDEELRCPISGEIPICNSSDLNEELGQVKLKYSEVFVSKYFFLLNSLKFLMRKFIKNLNYFTKIKLIYVK